MGQTWQVVAPLRGQPGSYLKWSEKLGKLLFDGQANALVPHLIVPVLPPEGQSRPPAISINELTLVKSTPKCNAQGDALPTRLHDTARTGIAYADKGTQTTRSICQLPPELLEMIFDKLLFTPYKICLCLASRQLWSIGRKHLYRHYSESLGRLAGCKIVCVGERVKHGDYPPGLYTPQKEAEVNDVMVPVLQQAVMRMFRLHHLTIPTFGCEISDVHLLWQSIKIYRHCRKRYNRHSTDPAFDVLLRDLIINESTFCPEDQPWILRNLTTKEFVRAEAISLKPEFIKGPWIRGIGFGEVVLLRISWSSSPARSVRTDISRGKWAGHCFDIRTLASHVSQTKGHEKEWKDVSEEVASEIVEVWGREFGPRWRELCCWTAHESRA